MTPEEIKNAIKNYIVSEFLPGEDPENLDETVRLVSDGILTSLASLKLVAYIEDNFGVVIHAHEVDAEHLDSLDNIAQLVVERRN